MVTKKKMFLMILVILLFLTGCQSQEDIPVESLKNQNTAVLSGNGIVVIIELPEEMEDFEQTRDNFAIGYLGETVVSFSLEQTTIKKELKRMTEVYDSLAIDYPDEYPQGSHWIEDDVVLNGSLFSLSKFSYDGEETIRAFSKLNYRYVLEIYISGDAIDADQVLSYFTSYTKINTTYQIPIWAMGFTLLLLVVALYSFISKIIETYVYPKTTGKIVDIVQHRRHAVIHILFHTNDGRKILGEFSGLGVEGMLYLKKLDQEVEVTYRPSNPDRVYIRSAKGKYIMGGLFLIIFAFWIYLLLYVV